jgi:tetratricopeptide (TPR) repeat protein
MLCGDCRKVTASRSPEMHERAAICMERAGTSPKEYYLRAANVFKDRAVTIYRENPDKGLQLLQRAADNFEKGGDTDTAIQCYEVGAQASLSRKDYLNAVVFYGIAGQHFEKRKEYKKAVKYYHEVAKLWDLQKVPENVAENYLRMASCLEALKELEYASQFYIKAGEKYEQARETYKAAKAHEKAAETRESDENFLEASQSYKKAAELIKSLKNMEKFEELYDRAADSCVKAGEPIEAVKLRLALTEIFADDSYRCSKHFEKAIASVEDNPHLKGELLRKQGDTLMEIHDYLRAAKSYKEGAELLESMREPAQDAYKKAGDAYILHSKSMLKVKNQEMAREGQENAVLCYQKAGLTEEVEKIRQQARPDTKEREKQITEELERLREDFEKGLLTHLHYQQIRESYQELLKNLKQ